MQLLLVQACGEIFHIHSRRLKPHIWTGILDVVKQLANHARDVDIDMSLRRQLAAAQANDKVSPFCALCRDSLHVSMRPILPGAAQGDSSVVMHWQVAAAPLRRL